MRFLLLGALLLAAPSPASAQARRTFTGTITDSMCATTAGHSRMQMGPTDAECTTACVEAHGATYMLFDGKTAYALSDQRAPAEFAGQKVRVTGSLDVKTRTIKVATIKAAK